jgi:hypothetical protein
MKRFSDKNMMIRKSIPSFLINSNNNNNNINNIKVSDLVSFNSRKSNENESTKIFVTGCNSPYFQPWIRLYESIKKNVINPTIYFFDLGLTEREREVVKNLDIKYNLFNFELYPNWVDINNKVGQWAWKSVCIKEVMNKYPLNKDSSKYLIWCDSRNIVDNNLEGLVRFLDSNGIYTNLSGGDIKKWTVNKTIEYFEKNEICNAKKYMNYPMINAALPCFNINIDWVREFIDDFTRLSLIKECISPEGSGLNNHRQDQSVLTVLYYKYKDLYKFEKSNQYEGIRHHTVMIKKPYKNF